MNNALDFKKTDLKTLIKARRFLILSGVMGIIAVLILLFGVLAQVGGLFDFFAISQKELGVKQSLQNKVTALQQVTYLDEFSKSKQVELALPSEKPLLQLLGGVNSVAVQSSVTLSDIQTNPGKLATQSANTVANANASGVVDTLSAINGVKILTITLKAHGTLAQINTFLDLVEKITPLTQTTKLKLGLVALPPNSPPPAPGTEQYEAELALSTYYFAQAVQVTVDAPLLSVGVKEKAFLKNLETFQFPDYQKQLQIQGGGSQDLFGTQ